MSDYQESRMSERYDFSEPVKFVSSETKEMLQAKLINCSPEGLYFESETSLSPGTNILISGADNSKYFRAEVKWCKKLSSEEDAFYGIGAEYCEPVSET